MFTRESQTCITTGEPELDEMDKFDADVELARHMVFDGEPTEWRSIFWTPKPLSGSSMTVV